MIFIAQNADFSANNLGQIDIDVVISPEVQSIGDAYGGLTTSKLQGLQTFYDDMTAAGFWSRLKLLYLPIFAPAIGKAFMNLLTKTVDWTPNPSIYSLNDNGIIGTTGVSDTSTLPYVQSSILNKSWMMYSRSSKTSTDVANGVYMTGIAAFRPMVIQKTGTQVSYTGSTSAVVSTARTQSTYNTLFATVIPTSVSGTVKHAGYGVWTNTDVSPVENTAQTTLTPFRINTNLSRVEFEIGGYAVIDAITEAEYAQLLVIFKKLDTL